MGSEVVHVLSYPSLSFGNLLSLPDVVHGVSVFVPVKYKAISLCSCLCQGHRDTGWSLCAGVKACPTWNENEADLIKLRIDI